MNDEQNNNSTLMSSLCFCADMEKNCKIVSTQTAQNSLSKVSWHSALGKGISVPGFQAAEQA